MDNIRDTAYKCQIHQTPWIKSKPAGIIVSTLTMPITMLPILCNRETRPPMAGREESQVESGVGTTNWHSFRTNDRTYWRGLNIIENAPLPFVVALATMFPAAHLN